MSRSGTSSSSGVQTLLAAEAHAQRLIELARQARQDQVKTARALAAREINIYRERKEEEFLQFVEQNKEKSGGAASKIARKTDEEIARISSMLAENKEGVIQFLITSVTDVCLETEEDLAKLK